MTPNLINNDVICDLQGQPLRPESATLLKALDKLLTVGAYYSSAHDQYLQAAMKARDDIVGVIGSPRNHVAIEITAQGLMIGNQNIDPNHRNVRLLHDLLVPLNIARLEIDGALTPEELRQALDALLAHKQTLGQSSSFQEIVIENLPASVRTVGCSVARQADAEALGETDEVSLDELLGKWGDGPTDSHHPVNESEQLARRFMDMVTQILENLEQLDREVGIKPQDSETGSYVTRADLLNLKLALQRLVEVNPDPAELTKLISQAQRALGLSRDPKSVNLVFQILKKDLAKENGDKAGHKGAKSSPGRYKLTVDELLSAVEELNAEAAPVNDPWVGSRANQLGIGLHLLRSDPPRALRAGLIELVELAVAQPDFAARNLPLCAQAITTVLQEDGTEGLDDLLPLVTGVLRRKRTEALAPFWMQLVDLAATDHLPELWPHLVNDILLGFDQAPRETVMELVLAAGDLPLLAAVSQGRRLEKQPALQAKTPARDLFMAPLPNLYAVHVMLMTSPLKSWVGEELFRALRTSPLSPLIDVLMMALGGHQDEHAAYYLELIQHGADKNLPTKVTVPAAAILRTALDQLAPEQRQAAWVPDGLSMLMVLDQKQARPILERVISERKFFFFRAWPSVARDAAATALAAGDKEVA